MRRPPSLPADRYGRLAASADSMRTGNPSERVGVLHIWRRGMDDGEFLRATLPALDLVYNLARRVVPRQMDAEDLVQETYLAALGAWRAHRRPRKVEPWIATICLNLSRSGYRHRARRPQEVAWEDLAPAAAEADPADEALAALDRRAVHDAMWSLAEGGPPGRGGALSSAGRAALPSGADAARGHRDRHRRRGGWLRGGSTRDGVGPSPAARDHGGPRLVPVGPHPRGGSRPARGPG